MQRDNASVERSCVRVAPCSARVAVSDVIGEAEPYLSNHPWLEEKLGDFFML